jgi:iron-sulfur cluster repair protein YtfE (RIC family)
MEDVLEDLISLLQRQDVNRAFELLDLFWTQLTTHIRSENVCLFPAILSAPRESFTTDKGLPSFEEVKTTIDTLRSDHSYFADQVSQALRQIRELLARNAESSDDSQTQLFDIRTRMITVANRLREHTGLELQQVYTWPQLLLPPAEYELLKAVLSGDVEKMPGQH